MSAIRPGPAARTCALCGESAYVGTLSPEGACRRCTRPAAPNPRAARQAAGLTQTQAAELIGASLRAFQDWEGARRRMPPAKYALFVMLTGYRGPPVTPPPATPAPRSP